MTLTHFKGKFSKGNISETIAATATLSCTVIQLRMLLEVDGICDLDLRKKVKTLCHIFRFSGSGMLMT